MGAAQSFIFRSLFYDSTKLLTNDSALVFPEQVEMKDSAAANTTWACNDRHSVLVTSFTDQNVVEPISKRHEEMSSRLNPKRHKIDVDSLKNAMALYNKLDGERWHVKTGWRSPLPLSQWWGFEFSKSLIVQINLGSNSLSGVIPAEIGFFKNIIRLTMNENTIVGKIPAEICALKVQYPLFCNSLLTFYRPL